MSVTYVIEFHVKADCASRFRQLLDHVLDEMRHEENFHNAILNQDPEDPLHFLLYETWVDHDDVLQVQLHRPYRREWHAALDDILEQPRKVSIWRTVRGDGEIE